MQIACRNEIIAVNNLHHSNINSKSAIEGLFLPHN